MNGEAGPPRDRECGAPLRQGSAAPANWFLIVKDYSLTILFAGGMQVHANAPSLPPCRKLWQGAMRMQARSFAAESPAQIAVRPLQQR